jgi:hypothetical protein
MSWCIMLCTAVTLAAGCSSSRGSESAQPALPDKGSALWLNQPLTIDGSDKDWPATLRYSVKEENVRYDIANDGQNLYVLVATKNQQEQQKMIQGGMSVWVNTKADKSNGDAVGIGYPLDAHSDPDQNLMAQAQPQRYQNNKPVTLEDKKLYALYGFNKDSTIQDYTYGDSNSVGVVMRMDYNNSGELIYEASIPLKALYPQYNTSSSYSSRSLAVGIFIQGLPPSTRVPRQGGGGSGVGVGGGVGMGTGGFGSGMGLGLSFSPGGFGGGRRNSSQLLYDDAQIWKVVQLAGR